MKYDRVPGKGLVPCKGSTSLTALSLVVAHSNQTFGASPDAIQVQEKAVPQGKDPPGKEDPSNSTTKHKGVIKPPQTGDEGIYTQASNPNAGTDRTLGGRFIRRSRRQARVIAEA